MSAQYETVPYPLSVALSLICVDAEGVELGRVNTPLEIPAEAPLELAITEASVLAARSQHALWRSQYATMNPARWTMRCEVMARLPDGTLMADTSSDETLPLDVSLLASMNQKLITFLEYRVRVDASPRMAALAAREN